MAIDLTGISNVNEFYSHHYLDSLLEGDLKGLFSKWKEEERTPDKRLAGLGGEYFKAKSNALNEVTDLGRLEYTHPFHYKLLEALGYSVQSTIRYTHEGTALSLLNTVERDGNEYVWMIQAPFAADDVNVLEQKVVYEVTLDNEEQKQFNGSIEESIQEIFRLDEPPRWLMLLAGQKVYLIDRTKWGQGKYLLFDLDEIFGRKQAETLKATAALLSKDALAPDEGTILHDELDEKSHKHAFSVSEDLKYGIRRAVELIGNEFIYYRSQVAKKKLYGDEELATKLTSEALNYLYRLLFLFYAESRTEELNVVPMKSEEYRLGYSLESLRELEQVPLTTEAARNGYYLHDSLTTLFKVVNEGYGDIQHEMDFERSGYVDVGFEIDGLHSPLFDPKQTPLLSSVKFRNFVLQEVIQLLSLSKEGSKQRGRISYAQLGINQLGAVYEGLLSYSGFFAQETLFEVKPAEVKSTDETGQSYFVPESEIEQYHENEFVYITDVDVAKKRKKYEKGSFIFRLAGRDREKSASYYTPEVLTKSLVKYSLKELLKDKTADDILKLTVCEPAMGSGAFLNEAVSQLADAYLERKQQELGKIISAEDYTYERQKVKAYIATTNVYGVDLNSTATELAKVSLWLNTIYDDAVTPWFSPKLVVGNSLIGVRKQVFNADNLKRGDWHSKIPQRILSTKQRNINEIYHFLVPDKGMSVFEKDKIVKNIVKDQVLHMKSWRTEFTKKFTLEEVTMLESLSQRIDNLWDRHYESKKMLLNMTHGIINPWGSIINKNRDKSLSIAEKEREFWKVFKSPTSPYRALKLIFDYWCTLWFWPIEKASSLPTRDEFLLDISAILDTAQGLGSSIDDLLNQVDRLKIVGDVASKNKFLHWELEFTEIMKDKNGFDLVLGNPPWIKIEWKEKGILSDNCPIIDLRNYSVSKLEDIREDILKERTVRTSYLSEFQNIVGQQAFMGSYMYEELKGIHLNLYKAFIVLSFKISCNSSVISIIHSDGIYEDRNGYELRGLLYPKLVYYFQYMNELNLFSEVDHHKKFACSIFRNRKNSEINFISISNLFHPSTIDRSFEHKEELDSVPGIKNNNHEWETKGHHLRVINYNRETLWLLNVMFEDENVPVQETRFIKVHSSVLIDVLAKLGKHSYKLNDERESVFSTYMFTEGKSQREGSIDKVTFQPDTLDQLVLSGPHFYVATPFNKNPNENCKNNLDYTSVKLTDINNNFLPRSNYILTDKGRGQIQNWKNRPVTTFNRIIYRKMLDSGNSRTLVSAIIPAGPVHIDGCGTLLFEDEAIMLGFSGLVSSIILDFYIKISGRSNLYKEIFSLPLIKSNHPLYSQIVNRVLLLNCLTEDYAPLWTKHFNEELREFSFSKKDSMLHTKRLSPEWNWEVPLRTDFERRQALLELDVLSALVLGLTIEELMTIYRVQFPVLQKYEDEYHYDKNGTLVPNNVLKLYRKKSDGDEISNLGDYSLPFTRPNRQKDYRMAYEFFSKVLQKNNLEDIYDSIRPSKRN